MIDVCYKESGHEISPLGRSDLIAELEATGLTFHRVGRPQEGRLCLLFAALNSELLAQLSTDLRGRTVLVTEDAKPDPAEAEATRDKLGLLGLIEPVAWSKWQGGLFVAWGFYGRPDIAAAAGLSSVGISGLQPANDRESLPEILARFLKAASLSWRAG